MDSRIRSLSVEMEMKNGRSTGRLILGIETVNSPSHYSQKDIYEIRESAQGVWRKSNPPADIVRITRR